VGARRLIVPVGTKTNKQTKNTRKRAGDIDQVVKVLAYHARGPGFNLQY
jgi:hypothetical protein